MTCLQRSASAQAQLCNDGIIKLVRTFYALHSFYALHTEYERIRKGKADKALALSLETNRWTDGRNKVLSETSLDWLNN